MKWLLTLALANPGVAAIVLGVVVLSLGGAATGVYFHVYNAGVAHERAAWERKVEEAKDKREGERQQAQARQAQLGAKEAELENELALEHQQRSDDLARALAADAASNAPVGVIPDAILRPFRAVGAAGTSAARGH